MRHAFVVLGLAFIACDSADEGVADTTSPPADTSPDDTSTTDTTGPIDTADTTEPIDTADTAELDTADLIDSLDTTPTDTADTSPPAPPAAYLTIAAVPPEMNGSRAAVTPNGGVPFRLRANRSRVDLDLIALPDSGPFTTADLGLTCTANGAPHAVPAAIEVAPGHLRVAIDEASAFPDDAAISCSASVSTAGGTINAHYDFDAATLPPDLDPFPATDVWLVLLVQDTFTLDVDEQADGTTELRSIYLAGGDGVSDFDAPFFEVGLMPQGDPEATALIRAHLIRRVRALINGIYGLSDIGEPTAGGVNLRLYFEGDEGAPDRANFGAEPHRFSMIAMTGDGDPADQAGTTFGRARIDWNNQDVEANLNDVGLGVWPAAIARTILRNPAGVLLLSDMRPALGGTPYGLAEGDELFIGQDLDPGSLPSAYRQRASRYNLLIQFGSLALAAILSHEIGHSLGLVPFGAPPGGLFAGVHADFTASFAPDAHIDTAGLNVMQTGASVNWLEAATGDQPRFEPLSWAYLRRQLVVGRQSP